MWSFVVDKVQAGVNLVVGGFGVSADFSLLDAVKKPWSRLERKTRVRERALSIISLHDKI